MKLKIFCKLIKKYKFNLSKFLTKFNIECLTCKRKRNRFVILYIIKMYEFLNGSDILTIT